MVFPSQKQPSYSVQRNISHRIGNGLSESHIVFYPHVSNDLQYYPEFENIWEDLTLFEPGEVNVTNDVLDFQQIQSSQQIHQN